MKKLNNSSFLVLTAISDGLEDAAMTLDDPSEASNQYGLRSPTPSPESRDSLSQLVADLGLVHKNKGKGKLHTIL